MKLNEKWTLFLIATFVTCFGVVDTLLKKTMASDVIINNHSNVTIQNSNNDTNNGKLTGILSYTVDNCLSSIEFSDGSIEFNSTVSEYFLEVTDFSKLEIYPKLLDDSFSYSVEKIMDDKNKMVVIRIIDKDDNFKMYTVYVKEIIFKY